MLVWIGKKKRSKMALFVNFDLFFGISLILQLNFNDIFAATDILTYFKIIPIDIFMKRFFFPTIHKGPNFGFKSRYNDYIFG